MQDQPITHLVITKKVTYIAYDVIEDRTQVTFTAVEGHHNDEKTYTLPRSEIIKVKPIPHR